MAGTRLRSPLIEVLDPPGYSGEHNHVKVHCKRFCYSRLFRSGSASNARTVGDIIEVLVIHPMN